MSENSFSEESNENNIKKEEIYDSLNVDKNGVNENKRNKDNTSLFNEDSIIEEDYEPQSKQSKINKNNKKNIKMNNNYSIDEDENDNNKNKNNKGEENKNNNDEESVNLGNSFSKISEKDKYKINEENNNKDIVTPNTSIYNLSENLNEKDVNNVEISNKNNNIINENKDKNKINKDTKKNESSNIFEDDSLIYHKKETLSAANNSINPNEEDNKFLYDLNIQFSKIGKPSENELNQDINNIFEDEIINLTDKNILNNKKKKNSKNIILKRFEQIQKNKNQKIKAEPINSIKDNSEKKINNLIFNESNANKVSKNLLANSLNANNYIYLCPFCNKETPDIIKLEGIQIDNNIPTIDKISLNCTCGSYELNLDEYIQKIEEQNEFKNSKDFCFNENHESIKGISYCSKCDKWFCQQCLLYHNSLLPEHIITPIKIPKYLVCEEHSNNILFYCTKCNIGICEKCKSEYHCEHYILNIDEYFNKTYQSLPFKTYEELNEFIEHCNRISEKEKNSYVNYIDDMIKKLNELKNDILQNYNLSKTRRLTQQKLVKYLFGNFICFNENLRQINNMNSINFICPSLFLYNDINFIKATNNYSLYLRKESFIEINQDKKLVKEELNKIFEKYSSMKKEISKNDYNSNKLYLNTLQSESNFVYPTLFKIYNNTGIYYGQIENNKRNGIGKQFNNKNEYEGIWSDGNIIKGKAIYYSDQGNIIYEGEFKDGIENGYGEKIYPNKRIYKGNFINGKIDIKYEIQKKLELNNI